MEIAKALKTQWEPGEDYAVAHTQAFCSFKTLSRSLPSPLTRSSVAPPVSPTLLFATIPSTVADASLYMSV